MAFTRDGVGNPLTQVTEDTTTTFSYDAAGRITESCAQAAVCDQTSDPFVRYAYDGLGNRLRTTTPAGTTDYAYNAANELLATSGLSALEYAYDANGNRITAGTTDYTVDRAGRMLSADDDTTTWTYAYDGDGVRTEASDGTDTHSYLWDRVGPLPELAIERDDQGALVRRYIEDQRGPLSMASSSATSYYHLGAVGSVSDVTSAAGAHHWDYRYDAFGNSEAASNVSGTAPENPVRFTGEHLDPTGLYHLRARQYDPGTGGFLGNDPVKVGAGDPYVSEYIYVNQRPTVFVDPSGEVPVREIGDFLAGSGAALRDTAESNLAVAGCLIGGSTCGALVADSAEGFSTTRGEHGLYVALNQFNPAFHALAAGDRCYSSVRAGEAYKSGRSCTDFGVSAAETVGAAAGGVGATRTLGQPRTATRLTPSAAPSAFHHTVEKSVANILSEGLRPGSYATPTRGLSPLQAHIELALNPAGGPRNVALEIDLDGMRRGGFAIPESQRVSAAYDMPGGGYEMRFPYEVPPEYIKVVSR